MKTESTGRLIILSGPSCVGKSPLDKALRKFFPELSRKLQKIVLYNSRDPRPGEIDGADYHFRTRKMIETMRGSRNYIVLDVRGDLHALDLSDLLMLLKSGDAFFEGNPYIGRTLLSHQRLRQVKRLSLFVSPLSKEEIVYLKAPDRNVSLPDLVTDVMRRKLLRRTRRQKSELSLKDLENIEKRASSAYEELKHAWRFDYVMPNHDGEDDDNWDAFYYPLGDARKTLIAFASLLEGKVPEDVEKWEEDLVP